MAITALTELQAVNIMLKGIGEAPISSLPDDADTISEGAQALTKLREVSAEIQEEAWHFNTDYDYELMPNASDEIAVPSNVARIDHKWEDWVERSGKIYDRVNKTFTNFTNGPYKFNIVWYYDWADLPPHAKRFIAFEAAKRFALEITGSREVAGNLEEQYLRAKARFLNAEADIQDSTFLDDQDSRNALER